MKVRGREIGPVLTILVVALLVRQLSPYGSLLSPLANDDVEFNVVLTDLGTPTCLHWIEGEPRSEWLLICDTAGEQILASLSISDGAFATAFPILGGLDNPHGVLLYEDPDNGSLRLIVSERGRLTAYDIPHRDPARWNLTIPQVLVADIPAGNHQTNAINQADNGSLIWHSGSTCNACEEADHRNAALLWVDPWSGANDTAATGVRNSFDGTWLEGVGYLFTDNGRDEMGGWLPEEDINLLSAGADYGWPDDDSQENLIPPGTLGPVATWTAHSSINGIDARPATSSLPGGEHTVYATVFGSWATAIPVGQELVRIDFSENPSNPQGWTGEVTVVISDLGTPLALAFHPDGDLYFADYSRGTLYRVTGS